MKAVALGIVILSALVGASAAAARPPGTTTPMTKQPPIVVAGTVGTTYSRVIVNPRSGRVVRAGKCVNSFPPLPTRIRTVVPQVTCRMLVLQSRVEAALRASMLEARLAQLNAEVKALQSEVRQLRTQLRHAKH